MLSYILVVAVLNVVLGFAVAMYIGRRYRVAADGVWTTADRFVPDGFRTLPEEQNDSVGEVDWYNDKLISTDELLRPMAETPDAATVEKCMNSLREATEEYLDNRNL